MLICRKCVGMQFLLRLRALLKAPVGILALLHKVDQVALTCLDCQKSKPTVGDLTVSYYKIH